MKAMLILTAVITGCPIVHGQYREDTIHLEEVRIIHRESLPEAAARHFEMDSVSMTGLEGRSLSELLGRRSSLHIKSSGRGLLAVASFRGTGASHTKVFWNGIRINSPMLGQVDFSLIPVWMPDKLSLIYGGSSLAYGSGAFGGVILLENKPEWNRGRSLELNQEIASFGTYSSYGRLEAGNEKIRSETGIYHTMSANDYPFFNTDVIPGRNQRLGGAEYRNSGLLQEIYFRPAEKHSLSFHLWYQDALRNLPAVMSYEGPAREEIQADRDLKTSLEWTGYAPGINLVFRSGYLASGLNYKLTLRDPDYIPYSSASREISFCNTFQADVTGWRPAQLRFRVDYDRYNARILDEIKQQGYHHRRGEASFLAGLYRQLGSDWIVYALARQERADGKWLPLMPSAGFRYRKEGDGNTGLQGIVSRNYNLPSLNDLYWHPGGNAGLRPENGINADLGAETGIETDFLKLSVSLNVFAAEVRDWILWKPTKLYYWKAENIARVFSRGVESGIGMDLEWNRTLGTLRANYAFTRSTNQSDEGLNGLARGSQLIYIPEHTWNMVLNVRRAGFSFTGSVSYTGRRYTQPGSEDSGSMPVLGPYQLTDLYLEKEFRTGSSRAAVRLAVYNLFNVSYKAVVSRPMPLRNYSLGLQWKINAKQQNL